MSSTPRFDADVKVTVMTLEAWAQPVVASCIDPVVSVHVAIWPASSESVRTPAAVANTRMPARTRGPGTNWKLRDVPDGESKKMWLVGSTPEALSHFHWP